RFIAARRALLNERLAATDVKAKGGFQFAPRIPDLKSRRLYSFGKAAAYPSPRTTHRRAHQHSAHPRPLAGNPAGCRLDPYGHRGRLPDLAAARLLPPAKRPRRGAARAGAAGTHAVHDWLADAELRRQTSRELNKGETRNSLARAVFIHRLGEIRDRTYENQQHRASGLNLLVTAIILWNTRYLER